MYTLANNTISLYNAVYLLSTIFPLLYQHIQCYVPAILFTIILLNKFWPTKAIDRAALCHFQYIYIYMYVCEDTAEDIHTETFRQRQTDIYIYIPSTYIIQTQTNITIYKYLLYQQQPKKAIITYKKHTHNVLLIRTITTDSRTNGINEK